MRKANPNIEYFDVFLCHNSEDKAEIRQIADELVRRGYKPWLDEREILPGSVWPAELDKQIGTCKAAAVFVGKSGIGPWQQNEVWAFIQQFVTRACPVIPVILSSAAETPELPNLLQIFDWVNFRNTDQDPYEKLIRGITGEKSDYRKRLVSASDVLTMSQDDVAVPSASPIAKPPDQEQRKQLGILRDRTQEYWVDGVLRQSLYHEVLISLGKRTMDAVVEQPPWKYVVDLPDRGRDGHLPDHNIHTIFDATGLLLILGEPGSGKTTSLLELAAILIIRANADPNERVPIVLNLSSWQTQQSLEQWIAAELSAKYRIPKPIASAWLAQDYLVPLLDGLDEVQPANQLDCVTAINTFIATHNPSGLVVCSRLMEYGRLTTRLKLNGAVCLEPLSVDDVNNFLTAGGAQLAGLQQALSSDPVLQELAQTPLMLSIMSLACEGADGIALASHKDDSPQARQEHIFQLYVERMFQRKKTITSPFSQDQIMGWLSWLARKMKEQSKSVFMVEELQPTWLSSKRKRWIYEAAVALSVGLLVALLGTDIGFAIDGSLVGALNYSLRVGAAIAFAIFLGCRSRSPMLNAGISGLIFMLSYGTIHTLEIGFTSLTIDGAFYMRRIISLGLIFALFGGLGAMSLKDIHPVETMRWRSLEFRNGAIAGSAIGFGIGLFIGVVVELIFENGEVGGSLLGFPLACGVLGGLLRGLVGGLSDTVKDDKVFPNQGIGLSIKNGLVSLLIALPSSALIWSVPFCLESLMKPDGSVCGMESLLKTLRWVMWCGLIIGLSRGGSAVVKHYALRLILWLTGSTPFRFIPFLDHCAKLILLKKIGGGYMFIHRTLLEYFAALPSQDRNVKKVSPGSAS